MIYSVNGEVVHLEQNLAVIECAGVGYACRCTSNTLSELKKGEKAKLFTYLNIREDAAELFGFSSQSELNCFKMLITVSGVGPKGAIGILSQMTPQAFALSVVSGDSKALTLAQGIGNKTAQRIVLELKDKLSKDHAAFETAEIPDIKVRAVGNSVSEAVSALVVLGFTSQQAAKVLSQVDPELPTGEMVKEALKLLAEK